jgi:hypothetical protein
VAATLAADRAFPAAVAQLDRSARKELAEVAGELRVADRAGVRFRFAVIN